MRSTKGTGQESRAVAAESCHANARFLVGYGWRPGEPDVGADLRGNE